MHWHPDIVLCLDCQNARASGAITRRFTPCDNVWQLKIFGTFRRRNKKQSLRENVASWPCFRRVVSRCACSCCRGFILCSAVKEWSRLSRILFSFLKQSQELLVFGTSVPFAPKVLFPAFFAALRHHSRFDLLTCRFLKRIEGVYRLIWTGRPREDHQQEWQVLHWALL